MLLLRREVFASLALRVSVFSSVFLVRLTVSQKYRNFKKRKRGNELGTIPYSRFGLQKRSVSAKTGAVQLACIAHHAL